MNNQLREWIVKLKFKSLNRFIDVMHEGLLEIRDFAEDSEYVREKTEELLQIMQNGYEEG